MFGYRHLSWSFSITYRFLADIFFKNQSAATYDYFEDSMAYIRDLQIENKLSYDYVAIFMIESFTDIRLRLLRLLSSPDLLPMTNFLL